MAVIIVEGADCSGKDSLIKELKRITGYSVVRGSSFELSKGGSELMRDIMLESLEEDNVILNRSYLSNIVYSPLFNYPLIQKSHAMEVTHAINETGEKTVLVYLYADSEILMKRMDSRGDEDVSPRDLQGILDKYSETISSDFLPSNFLRYDTEKQSSEEIAEEILNHIYKPSY